MRHSRGSSPVGGGASLGGAGVSRWAGKARGGGAPPTWGSPAEALGVCTYRPNRRRIGLIAVVVGTLLVAINQGTAIASGHLGWLLWLRVVLDYLTPTCVSTLGVLAGSRRATYTGSVEASFQVDDRPR